LKYHTIFEVRKSDGNRSCIPLECVIGIHEDIMGALVVVSAGDDVECSETYTDLRDRLEKFLLENQIYEEKQYEEREKISQRIEASLNKAVDGLEQ